MKLQICSVTNEYSDFYLDVFKKQGYDITIEVNRENRKSYFYTNVLEYEKEYSIHHYLENKRDYPITYWRDSSVNTELTDKITLFNFKE